MEHALAELAHLLVERLAQLAALGGEEDPDEAPIARVGATLDGFVASLKWEAGEHGVLVNVVSPGFTVTEGNLAHFSDAVRESVRVRTPSTRLSVPDDVASAVVYLGSPANGNITGADLPVAGGTD